MDYSVYRLELRECRDIRTQKTKYSKHQDNHLYYNNGIIDCVKMSRPDKKQTIELYVL